MTQWRIIGVGILVAGVVLLVLGLQATDSLGEEWRKALTGDYSDRTVWYLVGGAVAVAVGGGLALFSDRLGKRSD